MFCEKTALAQYKQDMLLLKRVQWRGTKKIKGLELLSYKVETAGLAYSEEEEDHWISTSINSWWEDVKMKSSSGAQGQDWRQWAQTKTQEVLSEHQETVFPCGSNWALAQRGYGVTIFWDIQRLSGQLPLGGSAWAVEFNDRFSGGSFQPQSFCNC